MSLKGFIDYLMYLWPFRKTKWGLFVVLMPIFLLWSKYVLPRYFFNQQEFYVLSILILVLLFGIFIYWLYHSGRIITPKQPFTVIFCLKSSDTKAAQYILNSMKVLIRELDKLSLLPKIHIKQIGQDIIHNRSQALAYRKKYEVDLIIWGEIFAGSKNEKEVCDFKDMFFTYKVPGNLVVANLSELFKRDINIAVVSRDWNIYEINSLPDTEKISAHLSEIILFILGLIYAQYLDFAEDSGAILECLFNLLNRNTKDEKILIDSAINCIQMSPTMLRKGRVLDLLLNLYTNLGTYFVDKRDFTKGSFYLDKCMGYGKKDIDILSQAALAAFYLKNMDNAKRYTDEINKIEKNHQIYILNRAFFGIYETNYPSALFFYKDILKRGRNVDRTIIIKVIAFLDERKLENTKEIAYDFAIGVLNKFYCQKKIGEKELRQFVRAAKKKEQYREMVSFIESEILPCRNKRKR